jgi:hypothetical protein
LRDEPRFAGAFPVEPRCKLLLEKSERRPLVQPHFSFEAASGGWRFYHTISTKSPENLQANSDQLDLSFKPSPRGRG